MMFKVLLRVFGLLAGFLLLATGCSNPEAVFEERMETVEEAIEFGLVETAAEGVAEVDPRFEEHPRVLRAQALIAELMGDHEAAAEHFLDLAGREPHSEEWLPRAFDNLLLAGDTDQALTIQSLFLEDDDAGGWRIKGNLHEDRGEYRAALDAYLRVRRLLEEPDPELELRTGLLFKRLDNLPRAEALLAEVRAADDPSLAEAAALAHLAVVYRSERWEDAERLLEEVDQSYPGALDGSPWAPIRGELRDWRAAREEARRLAEVPLLDGNAEDEAETVAEVPDGEAEELVADREPTPAPPPADADEEPKTELEGAKMAALEDEEMEPEPEPEPEPRPETAAERAGRMVEEGRYNEAVELYWGLLTDDIDNEQLWFGIASAFVGAGSYRDAEMAVREALRRDPGNLRYTLKLLWVVQEARSSERFLQELRAAQRRFPDSPDILLALARAYKSVVLNERNAALYYRRFLERAPQHPEAKEARRELAGLEIR